MDDDGFLYVMGRFKSLLISDDGEKFSPEGIEEAIMENSEYIDQCVLYNNQNPYTVGLIVINKEAINRWLKNKVIDKKTKEEAVIDVVNNSINQFRNGGKFEKMFPQRWLPASISILEEGFTEDNKLMNSTLKIVRPKITERYQERLDFMYTPEGKKLFNDKNIESVKQILN
jgi:long-chain acyl-CoA synthetase